MKSPREILKPRLYQRDMEEQFYLKKEFGCYVVLPVKTKKRVNTTHIMELQEYLTAANMNPSRNLHPLHVFPDNRILIEEETWVEKPVENSTTLPFGMYKIDAMEEYFLLRPMLFNSDLYLDLHNEIVTHLINNIRSFIAMKDTYTRLQLLHKRGFLLYGPPGNGKTMLIHHLIEQYQTTCYIIFIDSPYKIPALTQMRELLKGHLTFVIIEEITDETHSDCLTDLLNFLDGPCSWDDCITIATTNYPERLPGNIIDRPSRFDLVVKIDNPSEAVRRKYLEELLGTYPEEIIRLTKDRSMAYLKELCIQSLLHQKNIVEIFGEYEKMRQVIKTEFSPPAGEFV